MIILKQFSTLVILEVNHNTTLVLTYNQPTKIKIEGSIDSDTKLIVSEELALDGVTVKGKSFIFPAEGYFRAVIYCDSEFNSVIARVAYYPEGEALLKLAAGDNKAPFELMDAFDTYLANEKLWLAEEDDDTA